MTKDRASPSLRIAYGIADRTITAATFITSRSPRENYLCETGVIAATEAYSRQSQGLGHYLRQSYLSEWILIHSAENLQCADHAAMDLDMTPDFARGNPPWRGGRIGSGEQYRAVNFVDHPAKSGNSSEGQMTNLILHRKRRSFSR